jgi:hypothetical protein
MSPANETRPRPAPHAWFTRTAQPGRLGRARAPCVRPARVEQKAERRRPWSFVSRYRSIAVTVQVRPFLVLKVMSS